MLRASWLLLLCAACATTDTTTQAPREPLPVQQQSAPTLADADAHFQKGEWREALAIYRRELASRPSDLKLLNSTAHCEHLLGNYEASLASWSEMARLRDADPTAHYNVACANAKLGRTDAALKALETAVARGFRDAKTLANDTDLESLRSDPRFGALAARVAAVATGPRTPPPEIKEFAFWLGDWDVFNAAGARAGSSHIESILGDFVIQENWSGADGSDGKSFNTYDPATRSWRQHWVDDRGSVMEFRDGKLENGVLTFHASWKQPDGTEMRRRMSFTDLGPKGVRQYSERSADGGKSWTQEYELFYRRRHS